MSSNDGDQETMNFLYSLLGCLSVCVELLTGPLTLCAVWLLKSLRIGLNHQSQVLQFFQDLRGLPSELCD